MNNFKVGDKVRVVKKVTQEDGWYNSWTNTMDTYVGKEYVVIDVGFNGIGVGVGLNIYEVSSYHFPPSSLELVENPTSIKPRKHAELIKAWADGKDIQYKNNTDIWVNVDHPLWGPETEYRVKPKPDVVKYGNVYNYPIEILFDGDTGVPKSVKLI